MKKAEKLLLISVLLISGCSGTKDTGSTDTGSGPVVSEDTLSDEEKELAMIQECISDYNSGAIEERQDYYNITIPPLPIGITALPEISSLSDLTEIQDDEDLTNTAYVGYYLVNENYQVIFRIYHPTTNTFWLNGNIEFAIDPDLVPDSNPDYADTAAILDGLLDGAQDILNALYGINVSYDETSQTADGYYVFTGDGHGNTTIAQLKAYAESIYPLDYLETNYYPSAFEGDNPVYKEENGITYVYPSDDLNAAESTHYLTSKIIAVEDTENGQRNVDLLTEKFDQVLSTIYRITLVQTDSGWRLIHAY